MSAAQPAPEEIHDLDEGSWVYLSLGDDAQQTRSDFRQELVDACRTSGWLALSWSTPSHRGHEVTRFFEGMDHAVEHADFVVAMLDGESSVTDAELTLAYRHRRPVIGLSLAGAQSRSSVIRRMVHSYERGRVVESTDLEGCVVGLREALSDRGFVETIYGAAGEPFDRV